MKAAALQAAIAAAQASGGAEDFVKELEAKLEETQKEATDERPLVDKLAGCRAYIQRAEKRVAASAETLKSAQATHDKLLQDLDAHRKKLAELESEVKADAENAAEMSIDSGNDSHVRVQELLAEVAMLKQQHKTSRTSLIAQGTAELQQVREQCANLQAERDALIAQLGPLSLPSEVRIADVPTLEQDVVLKETQLANARAEGDVDAYEKLSAEHGEVSAALARAMRLRKKA